MFKFIKRYLLILNNIILYMIKLKFVLLGDMAVGKTSFMIQFNNNKFYNYLDSTIGAAFSTKVIKKKVEHFLLEKHVQKSKFSIVIGDEAHIDNIKTFRFFENPEMKTLSLIHSSYDPSMKLILNKTLREFCYFTTIEDIHEILNKLHTVPYHTLIELQDKEIKRHFNLI